jgi:ribosomal protein S18 acetylase RimI-like enzyme
MNNYQIVNTVNEDLTVIYDLFEEAMAYQTRKKFPVWAGYSKQAIWDDIRDKRQFKIVNMDGEIMCIFSICFSDQIIWAGKDSDYAVYLHRLVVNPAFKGQKHTEKIVNWTINFAKNNKLQYIRLDTWANNQQIIAYYKSFGFTFLENMVTPNSEQLPVQARGLELALLEMKV